MVVAAAGLADGAPVIAKAVEIQHGAQCCTLRLIEGADFAALVFALNSRLGLGGAAFHLTELGSDSIVPLTAALPGGLTLTLHLGGQLLSQRPQQRDPGYVPAEVAALQLAQPVQPAPPSQLVQSALLAQIAPPAQLMQFGPLAQAEPQRAQPAQSEFGPSPCGSDVSRFPTFGRETGAASAAPLLPRTDSENSWALQEEETIAAPRRSPRRRRANTWDTRNTWSPTALDDQANAREGDVSPQATQPDLHRAHSAPMIPHAASFEDALQTVDLVVQMGEDTAAAVESLDRFGRLNTDLANERTLLAWIRTAMAAMRTAFAFISIGAGGSGIFWVSSVWFARSAMVTSILVGIVTGIRRYKVIKKATFMVHPPAEFGRLSVFWFNWLIVTCGIVMMAGLYLDTWHKT